MTQDTNLSRRTFLKTSAVAAGGLVIGISLPEFALAQKVAKKEVMPNAWVRIGSDNSVTILCARSEMGQGVYTAMPTLVAEELEVDLNKIKVQIAPAGEPYINALLGGQLTGGSTSVADGYEKLRVAGAQARTMLIGAAAERWKVDPSACKAVNGVVIGPGGKEATYGQLADAAAKQPVPKDVKLKDASQWKYVGKPVKRLDTPVKVNGSAEFGIDVRLPGMLYAALAQCPVLGGKPVSFDDSKAKGMPGVKQVVQITDGVAVLADSYWHAKQALAKVDIKWDEGSAKNINQEGIFAGLRAAAAEKPGAVFKKQGDVEAAMKGAAKTVEATYELPLLAHATMEPMNFTAHVTKDSCLLYGPTQFQQLAAGVAQAITQLKPEQITVKTTFLGGGFGRRIDGDFIAQAIELSMKSGAPVKLIWSREDDMTHDFYRPASVHKLSAGLDAEGKPLALRYTAASSSVTARLFPPFVKDGLDPFMLEYAAVPYDIPNQLNNVVIHETGIRVGYWRSVSHALNAFAHESFVDELAAAAGKDPMEYRLALLDKHPRLKKALQMVAEKSGWGKPLPAGRARGVAVMEGYGSSLAQVAEVSVQDGRVRVHRVVTVADVGTAINPNIIDQQIESSIVYGLSAVLYGEVTVKNGAVQQTNFHNYPVLRINESPKMEVYIIAEGGKPGGIGEPATALIGPTVANAVAAATGKRIRKLPLQV